MISKYIIFFFNTIYILQDSESKVATRNSFFSTIRAVSKYYVKRNRSNGPQTTETKKYLKRRILYCSLFGHQKKMVTLKAKRKKRSKWVWGGVLVDCHECCNGILVWDGPSLSPDGNSGGCLQMGAWPSGDPTLNSRLQTLTDPP